MDDAESLQRLKEGSPFMLGVIWEFVSEQIVWDFSISLFARVL